MSLHQSIDNFNAYLSELTDASEASSAHAAAGQVINKELKTVRENLEVLIQAIRKECTTNRQFCESFGANLSDRFMETGHRDKQRESLQKALKKIEINGKRVSVEFPRQWKITRTENSDGTTSKKTSSITRVEMNDIEEDSVLEQVKKDLTHLSDADLSAIIKECTTLAKSRETARTGADEARQRIAKSREQAEATPIRKVNAK